MDVIVQWSFANVYLCLPACSIPVSVLCNPSLVSWPTRFYLSSKAQVGNGEGTDFGARLTELCHFLCEFKQLTLLLWGSSMTLTSHVAVKTGDDIRKTVFDT